MGSFDGYFYALDSDGTARWKFFTGNYIESSPAIAEDGTIYFGCWDGSLYAIEIIENETPYKPEVDGPTNGKIRTKYTYTAVTTDPDGNNISYFFDWGDDENSGWTKFVQSGEQINQSHKWTNKDTYQVKVKSQDDYGSESDWAILEVTIPRSQNVYLGWLERFPLLQKILGVLRLNIR